MPPWGSFLWHCSYCATKNMLRHSVFQGCDIPESVMHRFFRHCKEWRSTNKRQFWFSKEFAREMKKSKTQILCHSRVTASILPVKVHDAYTWDILTSFRLSSIVLGLLLNMKWSGKKMVLFKRISRKFKPESRTAPLWTALRHRVILHRCASY